MIFGAGEAGQSYLRARAFNIPFDWYKALSISLSSWLILGALTPIPIFMSRWFPLKRKRIGRPLLLHVIAGLVFGLGAVMIVATLFRSPRTPYLFMVGKVGTIYVIYYFALYWLVAGATHAINYAQLEEQMMRDRLELLRSKLNPHFLFNTLNAISTMALQRDHAGVTQSLGLVGDILRASLDESQPHEIPLERELELAEKYLAIQRIRFGDRLSITRDIDPRSLDVLVPSMLLQPLIENAVVHGVAAKPGSGWVRIDAHVDDGHLRLMVSDSGAGFVEPKRNGIGLANTQERLRTLYGASHRFTIGTGEGGGARVEIALPLRR